LFASTQRRAPATWNARASNEGSELGRALAELVGKRMLWKAMARTFEDGLADFDFDALAAR
jgi:hypothetical protein